MLNVYLILCVHDENTAFGHIQYDFWHGHKYLYSQKDKLYLYGGINGRYNVKYVCVGELCIHFESIAS